MKNSTYFHVGIFFHGREPGKVEPGHILPVLVVISFVFQVSERRSTQSMKLHGILLPIWTRHDINI